MLIEDKVFNMIDMILRLCNDTGIQMRAVKPTVQGLGDSESDYDDWIYIFSLNIINLYNHENESNT